MKAALTMDQILDNEDRRKATQLSVKEIYELQAEVERVKRKINFYETPGGDNDDWCPDHEKRFQSNSTEDGDECQICRGDEAEADLSRQCRLRKRSIDFARFNYLKRRMAEAEVARLKGNSFYPIQDGPVVPWSVMAPHEAQCQKNHGQSLKRLAERGGLGAAEAYCIIKGLSLRAFDTVGHNQLRTCWFEYAETTNGLKTRADKAEAKVAKLVEALEKVYRMLKQHPEAIRKASWKNKVYGIISVVLDEVNP